MITCKEDLIGTEFKVTCKEEADLLKEKCKSLGIEHATWSSCNYTDGVMRGVIGKDLGTYHSCKLLFTDKPEDSDSMDEFKSLRFVDTKDLVKSTPTKFVKVEESIFDLKEEFERGELYLDVNFVSLGVISPSGEYLKINSKESLCESYASGNVYRKVEIDWRDEVNNYFLKTKVLGIDCTIEEAMETSLYNDEFISLCHLVASLTEKPEGV